MEHGYACTHTHEIKINVKKEKLHSHPQVYIESENSLDYMMAGFMFLFLRSDNKDEQAFRLLSTCSSIALALTCCSFVLWKSLSHHSTLSERLPTPLLQPPPQHIIPVVSTLRCPSFYPSPLPFQDLIPTVNPQKTSR